MRKGMKWLAMVALVGTMVFASAVAAFAAGGVVTFGASGVMEKIGNGNSSIWSDGMRSLAFQTTTVDGPALYAVWPAREQDGSQWHNYVKFAKGLDSGAEWREDRIIAELDNSWQPVVDVSTDGPNGKGTIHVAFGANGATVGVYYMKSVDGGATWSTPVNVFASIPGYGAPYFFSIAADGAGNVYVAFKKMDEITPVRISASSDGINWNVYQIAGTELMQEPVIDTSPTGNVYVLYGDDDSATEGLYISKSTNGGQSWTSVNIYNVNVGGRNTALAVQDDQNIYVAVNDHPYSVGYTHNGGASPADWTFTTVSQSYNSTASIAVAPSGDVSIVLLDSDGFLKVARSKSGGATWTGPYNTGVEGVREASLAVDADGKAHVMFLWDWPNDNTIQITHEQ